LRLHSIIASLSEFGSEKILVIVGARFDSLADGGERSRPAGRLGKVCSASDSEFFSFVKSDAEGVLEFFHHGGYDGWVDQVVLVDVGPILSRFKRM
jgi:hypothetical protein